MTEQYAVRAKHGQPPIEPRELTHSGSSVPVTPYSSSVSGAFTTVIGGYGPAGLILHIVATILSLGLWLPVLATYLVCQRKHTVTLHIANGVVIRTENT